MQYRAPRFAALRFAVLFICCAAAAHAQQYTPEESPVWKQLQETVFEKRPINARGNEVVQLHMNSRADDAATVPILVRTKLPQTERSYIKRLWLVIDNNPSPIGVVFHLTPHSGQADIETRVRIENSTFVRAVAETNDGELFMDAKPIYAAGGCSGAALADEAAMASLGNMRIRLEDKFELNKPVQAKLMVSHPNFSGLSKLNSHTQYVKRIAVSYAGREILSADVDFTISENPSFRFYFVPTEQGELKAEIIDTNDLKFETSLAIKPEL
jgi:sulfur-oxidizing protein SoxY